ncbi:YkvA family protein [Pseudoalteromonas sp. YIC-656]|uniref:YkvA family protein n=1 Tax=Pseudoalteromonas pernae TaxID=3118054 RepID=UPI003242F4DB
MFKKFKDKAAKVASSASEASNNIKNKFDEAGVSKKVSAKLKSINLAVIEDWTRGSETPDKRSLAEKLKSSAKKVGEELYVLVMQTYIAMVDTDTPTQTKAILGAGLAYFVLPTDLVPDFIAGVGFTDDVAALALTAKNVGDAITEKHVNEAKVKWANFAESSDESESSVIDRAEVVDFHDSEAGRNEGEEQVDQTGTNKTPTSGR